MSATSSYIGSNVMLRELQPGRLASNEGHVASVLPRWSARSGWRRRRRATTGGTLPFYVDVRGLTTRRLHHRGTTFEIGLGLRRPRGRRRNRRRSQRGRSSSRDGARRRGVRRGGSMQRLAGWGSRSRSGRQPFGVSMTTRHVGRRARGVGSRVRRAFWEALDWTDRVLEEFSGWFKGKTSPVHLFWHGLDLAVTRFSGRDRPVRSTPTGVTQEAYSQRGDLVRVLGGRRQPRRRGVLLLHGARAARTARPAAGRGRRERTPARTRSRSCRYETGALTGCPTCGRPCSRPARARTRRARAPPAGTPRASSPRGAPLLTNDNNSKRAPPPISVDPAGDAQPLIAPPRPLPRRNERWKIRNPATGTRHAMNIAARKTVPCLSPRRKPLCYRERQLSVCIAEHGDDAIEERRLFDAAHDQAL